MNVSATGSPSACTTATARLGNVADPASPARLAEIGAHLDQLIAMGAELATS
jgi:hypothetical protein